VTFFGCRFRKAVVAHRFKERYAPGEPVPLLVAFGNTRDSSLYLVSKNDYSLPSNPVTIEIVKPDEQ
jgi:hypothetical protein